MGAGQGRRGTWWWVVGAAVAGMIAGALLLLLGNVLTGWSMDGPGLAVAIGGLGALVAAMMSALGHAGGREDTRRSDIDLTSKYVAVASGAAAYIVAVLTMSSVLMRLFVLIGAGALVVFTALALWGVDVLLSRREANQSTQS